MRKFKRLFFALVGFGLLMSLAGCKAQLLDPKGSIAAAEKKLLIDAVVLMLIVVVPVIILNFIIAYRYRASNKKATHSPNWGHSNLLEAIWWGIPTVITVILGIMTWVWTHRLDPYKPLEGKGKPLTIQVVALDWRWMFIYPQQGIATINYMKIPVNRQIQLLVTSDAPMNSIEIPQLAGQIYAMTGMQTKLHFDALQPGKYKGMSTNYSGDGFAGMKFTVTAGSNQDFNRWVATVKASKDVLTTARYNQLAKDSHNTSVMYFSSPAQGLYQSVINKYMMPQHSQPQGK